MADWTMWEQLAGYIAEGVDPPLDLLRAAIITEGVPLEHGQYVADRITALALKRDEPGRPPMTRWEFEVQLTDFVLFYVAVKEKQHELQEAGTSDPLESPLSKALKLVGDATGVHYSVKGFESRVKMMRKKGKEFGVKMPI